MAEPEQRRPVLGRAAKIGLGAFAVVLVLYFITGSGTTAESRVLLLAGLVGLIACFTVDAVSAAKKHGGGGR